MNTNHSLRKTFLSVSVATALCAGNASAFDLEEIVVTAQKREQNLQDVGIAVTAFSGDQLKDMGFSSTTEIVSQTPSLQVYEFSPSLTVYNLRGVSQNSFGDSLESPVAIYMDEAYVASMGALNGLLFDTERVEVLRGPQGTLYGRNATGGLIHYVSKKPTEEFDAYVEATVGNYDLREFEAAVGGTLIENKLLGRFAVKSKQQDGYLEWQRASGQTGADIRDSYGADAIAARGSLDILFSDNLSLSLIAQWSEDDDVPTGAYVRSEAAQDPTTGLGVYTQEASEKHEYFADVEGRFDRDVSSFTAKLTWDVNDSLEFVSITNQMDMEKSYLEDTEGQVGNPFGVPDIFGEFGTDQLPGFVFSTDQEYKQVSQEFRLSGEGDTLRWQTGFYYLNIETENQADVRGFASLWTSGETGMPSQRARSQWEVDTESYSVFGNIEYDLTETLALTAGVRWNEEEKTNDFFAGYLESDGTILLTQTDFPGFNISPICYSTKVDARCVGDTADSDAEYDYSDWAGKVQLDWRMDDDTLVYAGISRGIKGGNWSTPTFPDSIHANGTAGLAHDEETLYSYEAGIKLTLDDGLGRFNTSVFYYDYRDYQAFSVINFVQNISNNDAEITGAEFELVLTPAEGWSFILGGTYLDTEVEDIISPTGLALDRELPQAPEFSFNGLGRYDFAALGGTLFTQVDFNYTGEQWMEVTNADVDKEESHLISNARIGYISGDESWNLTGWVKNLANEEYRVYALDVSGAPSPFVNDVYASPRTYGVTVSYTFN